MDSAPAMEPQFQGELNSTVVVGAARQTRNARWGDLSQTKYRLTR